MNDFEPKYTEQDFLIMGEHAFEYDESGNRMWRRNEKIDLNQDQEKFKSLRSALKSKGDSFYEGEEMKGQHLDMVIREQMYSILKTNGDFDMLIKS